MERYQNLGGDSGIVAYEIGDDFIKVQFHDGPVYLYTYESTGQAAIEHMKELARAGHGLNSYISRVVRKQYAAKLR
jgi:hypothetical protein